MYFSVVCGISGGVSVPAVWMCVEVGEAELIWYVYPCIVFKLLLVHYNQKAARLMSLHTAVTSVRYKMFQSADLIQPIATGNVIMYSSHLENGNKLSSSCPIVFSCDVCNSYVCTLPINLLCVHWVRTKCNSSLVVWWVCMYNMKLMSNTAASYPMGAGRFEPWLFVTCYRVCTFVCFRVS